jgi:hypothetical protein
LLTSLPNPDPSKEDTPSMTPRTILPVVAFGALFAGLSLATSGCVSSGSDSSFSRSLRDVYTTTGDAVVWVEGDSNQGFEQLLVEPLRFQVFSPGRYGQASPAAETEFVLAYDEVMQKVIGAHYPFVSRSGPGILRISAAITDRISVPELLERADWIRAGTSGDIGTLALEMRFYDGEDDEPFAALVTRRHSNVFVACVRDPAPGPLRNAFFPMATQLKAALDNRRTR